MLDDLKYIHQRDSQDALGIAQKEPDQLLYTFEAPSLAQPIDNVVYAGMGGSALAALISQSWPGHKVPFEVCREYHAPTHVSAKTLFIACSYSGNTEETLSALTEAEASQAQIVVIAGGGKLQEIAQAKAYPFLLLPHASQPRFAVFYNFKALLTVLAAAGLIDDTQVQAELSQAADFLRQEMKAWLPDVAQAANPAKQLAAELAGKSILIYAGPVLAPAAYKWKISFNENSKNIAWWNELSELNHNEISGWLSQPTQKPYGIVEIHSHLDHPRIERRYEVMDKMLSGKRPFPNPVHAKGESKLEQLLWTIMFGDFTSIYLALVNNIDPSPVELQENFKKELG
jgi:glucose/mannose-6-phosphate isomerase